jgi:hypothetical protein
MSTIFREIKKFQKSAEEAILFTCGGQLILDRPITIFYQNNNG